MKYRVATFRDAGLEAKWGKTHSGRPAIFVRHPEAIHEHQRTTWYMVTDGMFNHMKADGIIEGYNTCTLLADVFSIPA